ncbi:MAG: protein-L-isoaspartate(D-aspartate) O-methyltransferase [Sulfurimicrobium sp.]|jgi:protein-L-isoaspartate(D-aspartate) O-methyltransferase|nr:protein-L-isoaspartate(D-aspartate) O-methyltransferase [Sulfurimicrobium sp.]MDO9189199.1 protein-L-isoaspartate(D-aspartate) O-methyltransferase [Sulfurimicrobium sp.]MDP1704852.1 protein-L-isoaspartate(D-aspartate) O-methyltransferase [Sulfurimicrobium sp.]MDP1898345.1 protein-L-isoaspartate(D-aspartate) O-methyltransferase [Sulfurimicrobium sp.]MDP2197697.1 protein-L-isoaspartate(D-aspartate) O-methyltransferase [Sulfurimicrobium sp.]
MNVRISGIGMTSQRTRLRMVDRLRSQGIKDEVVLSVMGTIPRHIFIEEALSSRAYEDTALPIGFGQTISNPYTVARMTEILRNGQDLGKVLEIGTGCGYQTAVLSKLSREVFTVERISPLLTKARKNIREAHCNNVRARHADGGIGIAEAAPFDAIIMTAASTHIPSALLQQLAVGGRLVMPIGSGDQQRLHLIERTPKEYIETVLEAVKFVPLLGGVV